MLFIVLTLIGAVAAFYYLRMVRQDSYERGYIMGHAQAARELRAAMDRCQPPF